MRRRLIPSSPHSAIREGRLRVFGVQRQLRLPLPTPPDTLLPTYAFPGINMTLRYGTCSTAGGCPLNRLLCLCRTGITSRRPGAPAACRLQMCRAQQAACYARERCVAAAARNANHSNSYAQLCCLAEGVRELLISPQHAAAALHTTGSWTGRGGGRVGRWHSLRSQWLLRSDEKRPS